MINTWIIIKKCVTTLKKLPYVKQMYTYCVAKSLYHRLKEITTMNNKQQIYILGLKNK